jgi:hypothetical protein
MIKSIKNFLFLAVNEEDYEKDIYFFVYFGFMGIRYRTNNHRSMGF